MAGMKWWLPLVVLVALVSCTAAPVAPERGVLLDDQLFVRPSSPPASRSDLFALTPDMEHYLVSEISPKARANDPKQTLFDALYSNHLLKIDYDSTLTRNAAEAFSDRSGNCLSLVILTSAFAKRMGISVQYQQVFSTQVMSRVGDLIYFSSHVNISLAKSAAAGRRLEESDPTMTIDFYPLADKASQRARVLAEKTIVAMYYNNRAAEWLGAGEFDQAYWAIVQAIDSDPRFLNSYNTLGVIYRRHGNLQHARRAFEYALQLEPGNAAPMSNLATVLDKLGLTDEADHWREKRTAIQGVPPFHYFDLGVQALKAQDYARARDLFAQEVARAAYYHEFHAGLSAAYAGLGDIEQARKHLEIALNNATTRADKAIYAAKLELLEPRVPDVKGVSRSRD